jgi:CheY-like chemotaxis protein
MALILLIEDDFNLRQVLTAALEKTGHEVMEAPNGKIGIEEFIKRPADLVVTDLFMPEQDGIETIMILKNKYPDVKIIAMSGGGRMPPESYLESAKILGAIQVLSKPFEISDFLDALDMVLGDQE